MRALNLLVQAIRGSSCASAAAAAADAVVENDKVECAKDASCKNHDTQIVL